MLCQMLSLPDGWEFSIEGLSKFSSDGITVVRSAVAELEACGYIRRTQLRTPEGKMAGVEYIVSEFPMSGEPISENPISEDIMLLNTNISNTNKLNTKFIPPSRECVQKYISEQGYSVDADRFIDYYTANGWKVGKNRMKDWKAAVRNWERSNNDTGRGNSKRSRISETTGRSDRDSEDFGAGNFPMAKDFFIEE